MVSRKDLDKADAELDRELEDTFPASDPPAVTRFPAGHDYTPSEDAKADEASDETPSPLLPKADDLKW